MLDQKFIPNILYLVILLIIIVLTSCNKEEPLAENCVNFPELCVNGNCNEQTGVCECDEGWMGENCDEELTENCINFPELCINGTCNEQTGDCECDEGWTGENCDESLNTCAYIDCGPNSVGCVNNGDYGICICATGWYGEYCEQYDCSIGGGCNNGTCMNNSLCDCNEGWGGADCTQQLPVNCEVFDCGPNAVDCVDGFCICSEGWFGQSCESTDPCINVFCNGSNAEPIASSDNSDCTCECTEGYFGENCTTHISSYFIGNYSVSSDCNNEVYASNIVKEEGGNVISKVIIENFANLEDEDGNSFDIVAEVNENNELEFTAGIIFNNTEVLIFGNGAFLDDDYQTLIINFYASNLSDINLDCQETYTRQ